ncbi:psbP domain-containing protein 7, chloroplastic [Herrania umbratica]|uniref:PsbP domain-containing protein 7, chloroplastic n=1 Tax=Herrania umbratica TaxID=108875 RepID=A0A6J1A656_9ROSI|nr:psbP domain-containing protein 7, chloroplastic [Herrania umbratica]
MALQQYLHPCKYVSLNRIYMTQSSNNGHKESFQEVTTRQGKSPAEEFAPLATTFRRRLLVGVGSASLVAVGANFGGLTSFLLGLSPEGGRNLKLDVLYPIEGFSRRIENNEGFEFIYPASWVGDQRLLYRAAERLERSLDPLPTSRLKSSNRPRKNVNEPIVAYGPPGSSGELNVSVIVSPVPLEFSIETFGGPKEVGEAVIRTITGQRPDVKGTLIESTVREDPSKNVKYYELEFRVESPSFQRHNVAVCCARGGRLFTLNAQATESAWPEFQSAFYRIANSFSLTT